MSRVGGLVEPIIMPGGIRTYGAGSHNELYYAAIKQLGSKINAKACALLVAEYKNENNPFSGAIGTLFGIRGSASAYLSLLRSDIYCAAAYNQFKLNSSTDDFVCGKFLHNGKYYVAVNLGSGGSVDIYFTGFYSPDCVFQIVEESSGQWL